MPRRLVFLPANVLSPVRLGVGLSLFDEDPQRGLAALTERCCSHARWWREALRGVESEVPEPVSLDALQHPAAEEFHCLVARSFVELCNRCTLIGIRCGSDGWQECW